MIERTFQTMCDKDCGSLVQLAMFTTAIGEKELKIMNLERERDLLQEENQKLKEKLLENGIKVKTIVENDTPDASDNESQSTSMAATATQKSPNLSTSKRSKRNRFDSEENNHTPPVKKSNFGKFKCPQLVGPQAPCRHRFVSAKLCQDHQMEEHDMELFCDLCPLAFKTENKTGLKNHRRSHRKNDENYRVGGKKDGEVKPDGKLCADCGNVYALCNFNAHLNKFH